MKAYTIWSVPLPINFFKILFVYGEFSSRPPGHHLALSGGPTEDLVDWGNRTTLISSPGQWLSQWVSEWVTLTLSRQRHDTPGGTAAEGYRCWERERLRLSLSVSVSHVTQSQCQSLTVTVCLSLTVSVSVTVTLSVPLTDYQCHSLGVTVSVTHWHWLSHTWPVTLTVTLNTTVTSVNHGHGVPAQYHAFMSMGPFKWYVTFFLLLERRHPPTPS